MKNSLVLKPNNKLSLETRKKYAFWRNVNFLMLILSYSAFYIVKYAYKKAYGDGDVISTGDYATIAMLFNISYGMSKFTTGQFADRVNSRYLLCGGLALTSIFNIISGSYSNVIFIGAMLMLVAWFQGFGWPPTAKMFTKWFVKKERGWRLGTWSIAHNIGGSLAPLLAIPLAFIPLESLGRMLIPSIIGLSMSVICFFLLKETPDMMGLPRVEKYLNVQVENIDQKDLGEKNSLINNIKTVIRNKWIWIFLIAYTTAMIFRMAPGDFMFKYISGHHHLGGKKDSGTIGNISFMLFEWMGIPASITVGMISDYLIRRGKGRFGVQFAAFIVAIVGLVIMWIAPVGNKAMIIIGIIVTSWPTWMIISMGGPILMDLTPKRAITTAIGFKGLFGYVIASILADKVAGIFISDNNWNGFFIFIIIFGVIGTICFGILRFVRKEDHEDGKYEELSESKKPTIKA